MLLAGEIIPPFLPAEDLADHRCVRHARSVSILR